MTQHKARSLLHALLGYCVTSNHVIMYKAIHVHSKTHFIVKNLNSFAALCYYDLYTMLLNKSPASWSLEMKSEGVVF